MFYDLNSFSVIFLRNCHENCIKCFNFNIDDMVPMIYRRISQGYLMLYKLKMHPPYYVSIVMLIVSPVRMYIRGILWFSRRYAGSADISSFSR